MAQAEYTLHILHINDFHSRVEAVNAFDSTCSAEDAAENKCFGGIARVKAKIDELRGAIQAEGGNVLVMDAGDQFQGSLFYTTYKGDLVAELVAALKPDVMALGNHEFDDGPEGLVGFLDKWGCPSSRATSMSAGRTCWRARCRTTSCWRWGARGSASSRRWRRTRRKPPAPARPWSSPTTSKA